MTDLQQTSPAIDTTADVFLGDRLVVRQPRQGYRAGVDAVLLAATVDAAPGGPVSLLDIGAGAGTVGLCAAARLAQLHAVLLERDPVLAHLAASNVAANGLEARVRAVCASTVSGAADLACHGLQQETFDVCLANPPFHDEQAGTLARDALKAASHAMPANALEDWARFMARMAKPGGRATMIHKADALPHILDVMTPRFGALTIFPIFPRAGEAAIRVIVSGTKGSKAPLTLKNGLVLHGEGQGFTSETNTILRYGAPLAI